MAEFVDHYNGVRLHSALGYITPNDWLAGRAEQIWAERDRKLEAARDRRAQKRAAAQVAGPSAIPGEHPLSKTVQLGCLVPAEA